MAWDASTASASRTPARVVPPVVSATPSARLRLPGAATGLRIDGQVAIAGVGSGPAMVTLRVGDAVSTVPVSLPAFSVQVPGVRPEAMVSIEIVSGHGKHAAILGSYTRLARKAGADAVLTTAELDRVRVTAMGTSLHHHVSRVLGGRLPLSDEEHQQAIRSIGLEAAVGGNVLQALASGAAPLPAGYAHGYALLQDEAGLRMFLAAQPGVAASLESFAQQPTGIALPLAALGARTAILPAVAHGEATLLQSAAQVLVRGAGGFEYHGRSGTDPGAAVTALDAGALRMTPRAAAPVFSYEFVQLAPGQPAVQVLARHDTVHETWRRHFVGDRYSLWSVTGATRVSYPDHPHLAPSASTRTRIAHAFNLDGLSQRIWPAEVIGRRALPHFCLGPDAGGNMDVLSDCEYAQTTFLADGRGLVEDTGSKVDPDMQPRSGGLGSGSFEWKPGPRGTLQLRSPQTEVTYWRLEGGESIAVPVLYLARRQAADGLTHSLVGTSVLMDARVGAAVDPLSVLGSWEYGTFNQGANASPWQSPRADTTFVRDPDGITRQVTRYPGAEYPTSTSRASWQLFGTVIGGQPHTRLYESRYRGNIGGPVPTCSDAYAIGATECMPLLVRYFRPMAQRGDRTYGIEELYQNVATFGEAPVIHRYVRPTYHQRVANDIDALPRLDSHARAPRMPAAHVP